MQNTRNQVTRTRAFLLVLAIVGIPGSARAQEVAAASLRSMEVGILEQPSHTERVSIHSWPSRISLEGIARPPDAGVSGRQPARPVRIGLQSPPRTYNTAERIAITVGMGVAGFFAGGYVGAKIEGNCACDDPGLKGALIGAPIGGVAGAIFGAWLSR